MKSIRLAACLALLIALPACSDSTDPGEDIPTLEQRALDSAPIQPIGTHAACFTNATAQVASTNCWVIRYQGNIYWAFTYDDRESFNLAAYSPQGSLLQNAEKPGAHNLWLITIDVEDEEFTLHGEGHALTLPWSDLIIATPQGN